MQDSWVSAWRSAWNNTEVTTTSKQILESATNVAVYVLGVNDRHGEQQQAPAPVLQ
jgi:hypothetical protein